MEMEIYELLNDDLESKRNLQEAIALLKLKNPNELDTVSSEDGGGDAPYERKGHGIVARLSSSEKGRGVVSRTKSVERCASQEAACASAGSRHRCYDVVDTHVQHGISMKSARSSAARSGGEEQSKENGENSSEMSSELRQILTKMTQQMDSMSLQLQGLSALPSVLQKQAICMFSS